jgi:hypothetical protein
MNETISSQAAGEPVIHPETVDMRRRSPWRLTSIALILTLLLGAVGGGWVALNWQDRLIGTPAPQPAPAVAPALTTAQPPVAPVAPVAAIPLTAGEAGAMAARVSQLEERLSRLTLATESASGNAARAEALLVAFAARRAIERGFPLGGLEAQLRLRFGETQPNAVSSILAVSAMPITNEALLSRLDALESVAMADSGSGWLTRIGNNLSSMVVLRRSEAPSTLPTERFSRARRALEGNRIDDAIVEVTALPGAAEARVNAWITDARRLHDARRALDLIETAAILEPGQNRLPAER